MATYYINADTGNDSTGTGTSGNPWQTINKAFTASVIGDTVYLQKATAHYAPGTTSQDMTNRTWIGITGNPFDVVLDGGGSVGTNFQMAHTPNATTSCSNVRFTNGSGANNITVYLDNNNCTVNITNCVFDNQTGGANGNRWGVISAVAQVTLNVTGCLFYNLAALAGSPGGQMGVITLAAGGPMVVTCKNCTFSVINQTNNIKAIFAGLATLTVINCIFRVSPTLTLGMTPACSGTITFSDLFNVTPGGIGSTVTLGSGNITGDPLFVDEAAANFNLRPTSPCIDAGSIF